MTRETAADDVMPDDAAKPIVVRRSLNRSLAVLGLGSLAGILAIASGLTVSFEKDFASKLRQLPALSFDATQVYQAQQQTQRSDDLRSDTAVRKTSTRRSRQTNPTISDDAAPDLSARQQLMRAVDEFEQTPRREI